MNKLDTRTWIAAARRYVTLRRRFWRSTFLMIALFTVIGTPVMAFGDRMHHDLRSVWGSVLALTTGTCWIVSAVSWLMLMAFRCPRCGNHFMWSAGTSWPTNQCKHCGLDLGPASMADSHQQIREHPPEEARCGAAGTTST